MDPTSSSNSIRTLGHSECTCETLWPNRSLILVRFEDLEVPWKLFGHPVWNQATHSRTEALKMSPNGGSEGHLGSALGHVGVTWRHFGHLMGWLGASLGDLWSKLGAL